VDVDNRGGACRAVTHLFDLGHTRVATITGARNTTTGQDRYAGYADAHRARALPIDETLIIEGDYSEAGGYRAMNTLLEHHPDAVFAASDMMAIGAMRAIHEVGLVVPDDIAVVGFDDLPPAARAQPPLTTVHQPVRRFGAQAVELLLDLVETDEVIPRSIVLDTALVIRASCGAL
jgi:LacI family transcriptional regulator